MNLRRVLWTALILFILAATPATRLLAQPQSTSTIVPYQPTGWSSALVVTKTQGTHTSDSNLSAADTLYANWAVANNGTSATTSTFNTQLMVDGVVVDTMSTSSALAAGTYVSVTDYKVGTLAAGTHTFTLVVDSSKAIDAAPVQLSESIVVNVSSIGTWASLLNQPSVSIANCLLLTDGRVMCHQVYSGNWWALTPSNTGSYARGTWTQLASLPSGYAPLYYSSVVLPDGRLVIMGGEFNCPGSCPNTSADLAQGAIYDPVADSWTPVAAPTGWKTIGDAMGIVLANGTYMLSSCCNSLAALLNATALTWTPVTGRQLDNYYNEESWVLLPDGTLLTVDVWDTASKNQSERFNPTTQTWSSAGTTPEALADNSVRPDGTSPGYEIGPGLLRPDGTVLWIGAVPEPTSTAHSAIYNTLSNAWSAGPDIPNNDGGNDAPGAVLPNGNVLTQLSPAGATSLYSSPSHFYEFDGANWIMAERPPYCSPTCSSLPTLVGCWCCRRARFC